MVRNNVYSLAKFLWSIDLRPIADKLTKDYLVIYGSRDAMACHAGLASSSLYNLTKNLTAQYTRNLCAVLPLYFTLCGSICQ